METFEKTALNKVVRGPKRAIYDRKTIYDIVDNHMICHVAYNYQGTAITIPTGYGRKEDTIYLHGSMKNRMMLGLTEQEQVSITVTHLDGLVLARSAFHHSVNYRSAVLFGKPRLLENEDEKMEALRIITDNFIEDRWEEVRQPNRKELNGTLVIEINIESASAKVRAEGVNDEKSDHELDIWAGVIPLKTIVESPISEEDLKPGIKIPDSVKNFNINRV